MGCIGSRVSDYESSSPTHIEQRSPLINSSSQDYVVRRLTDSPSVNTTTHPATMDVISSDSISTASSPQHQTFSDGGQSVNSADGAPPSLVTSRGTDSKGFYGQALGYDTAASNGGQPNSTASDANSSAYATDSLAMNANGIAMNAMGLTDVKTTRGNEIIVNLKKAYEWKTKFDGPTQQFLSLMDRLYMECQLHLTALSSYGDVNSRREADVIVNEMICVRNHWGPKLLPSSICNAFVRERLTLTLGIEQRKFRIDCAQFFEPVPFYGGSGNNSQGGGNHGELMKLYRFSVYDLSRNEVILRYYLERSNVTQLYHVLCFTCENYRGQVHPYGTESPSYWEVRHHMLEDVYSRLLSALSQGSVPAPQTHASTIFPATRGQGPVIIQVPSPQPLTVQH